MLFHHVSRYNFVAKVVNSIRNEETFRILEVGSGAHGNLSKFLPNDDIVFLDIELPEEVLNDDRFVIGDATDLKYNEDSFDIVIALDVLEHIPKEKRLLFFRNIDRVAKRMVLLTFPYDCEETNYDDNYYKIQYTLRGIEPPIWIDEHINCVLPKISEVKEYLDDINADNVDISYAVRRSLINSMLTIEALTSNYYELSDFFKIMNDDYIKNVSQFDEGYICTEAIKMHVIWGKEAFVNNDKTLNNHDKVDAFENRLKLFIDKTLLNKIINDLDKKCKNLVNEINISNDNNRKIVENTLSNIYDNFKNENRDEIEELTKKAQEFETYLVDSLQGNKNELKRFISEENRIQQKELVDIIHGYDELRVNVVLITYNHEKYIEESIRSIINQKVNFKFNIIVADDCSTDSTVNIIKRVEKETDIEFIYLDNSINHGTMKNYKRAFSACDAEYISIMEGDDVWTDPMRLKTHVAFLDNHTDCVMVFNRFSVRDGSGVLKVQPSVSLMDERCPYKFYSGHDLAYDNIIGNFSTCTYRNSSLKMLPEQLYDIKGYDWITNLMISMQGCIGCIIRPMSEYRVHANGLWSSQDNNQKIDSVIELIDEYNVLTNYLYAEGFAAHKNRLLMQKVQAVANVTAESPSYKLFLSIKQFVSNVIAWMPPIILLPLKLLLPKKLQELIYSKL